MNRLRDKVFKDAESLQERLARAAKLAAARGKAGGEGGAGLGALASAAEEDFFELHARAS